MLSNSTNFVHSEQMLPLDGSIRLGKAATGAWQLENRSQLNLRSIGVVRKQNGAPARRVDRRTRTRAIDAV